MRNLKKVLSLVLCMAVMLSVMVVGAGAAFKDQSKIVNTEAVDMCSALNIINGYEDGSFKPEGNITRAEACKMICVALNGGKEPVLGTNATASFTDIKGHWAEGYIEYCYAEGIVAGVGGGKFDPAGNVTGSQFAKMLLIALGYSADHEKFVGSAWEVNVNVKATQKGLYEDLETMDPSVALTRDNAAQMLWNALQANEVEYTYTLVTGANGELTSRVTVQDKKGPITLLEDKYNTVDTDETTGILTGISYNTTKEEYTYAISTLDSQHALVPAGTFTTEDDYTALLGNNVTFVVKEKTNDVYGAFAKDSVELISGLMGDIDYADVKTSPNISGSIEVDDTDYDVDTDIAVIKYTAANHKFVGETVSGLDNVKALAPYYEFSAIDWDDDDDIDLVIVYPVSFGEVKYVGSDYVRIAGMNDGKNMDTEDYTVYSGIAKEDYAVLASDLSLKTDGIITKLEKNTAKVDSTKTDKTAVLGGTSYDVVSGVNLTAGDEYDFYVINNYVVKADPASSVVDLGDFLLVTGTPVPTSSGYYQVDVLFTDNTSETITIKSVNDGAKTNVSAVQEGTLFTYEVSSGKYELTTMDQADLTGFDKNSRDDEGFEFVGKSGSTAAHFTVDDAKTTIDDGAVIFVKDDDDYSVITGAALKKIADAELAIDGEFVGFAGAEEDNGYNYVTFAYVSTSESGSSDEVYGFITSAVTTKTDADGTYYIFDVWTADGLKEDIMTVDTADLKGDYEPTEQAFVTFTTDADGNINKIEAADVQESAVAITGLNADKDMVRFNGQPTDYEIDEDTVILFINFQDKTGEKTGNVEVADKTEINTGISAGNNEYWLANANYVASSDVLKLLVVDYTGDWNNVNEAVE